MLMCLSCVFRCLSQFYIILCPLTRLCWCLPLFISVASREWEERSRKKRRRKKKRNDRVFNSWLERWEKCNRWRRKKKKKKKTVINWSVESWTSRLSTSASVWLASVRCWRIYFFSSSCFLHAAFFFLSFSCHFSSFAFLSLFLSHINDWLLMIVVVVMTCIQVFFSSCIFCFSFSLFFFSLSHLFFILINSDLQLFSLFLSRSTTTTTSTSERTA